MTKISALSDIGTSVASNDTFVLVDVSDPTTPNKKIQQQNILAAGGLLPDGSVGTPGLRFTSDTDVGLFRPTTDTLGFATGGSERLRIDSAGNVGIGTSSPANFAGFVTLALADAAGAEVDFVKGSTVQGSLYNASDIFYIESKSTVPTAFVTNGTERLRITSAGQVGIGTASPRQALTFGGLISTSTSTPDCIDLGATFTSTSASTNLKFKLYVDSSGNTYGFTVNGSSQLEYYAGTVSSPGNHVFLTGGTERARIDSSGRLLVGTASASGTNTLFESSSTTANAANVALVKRNSGTADQAGQQLHFYNFGPAGTGRAADTEVGSMRFYGSQPTSGAGQEMARITCAADLIQTGLNTSGRLVFSTTADGASSPTERMRISANGGVRINCTDDQIISGETVSIVGLTTLTRSAGNALVINRATDDGNLVVFYQEGTAEGTISVSGTTVSYNGAHLSRWSQLPSGAERTEILRGSVLSNIDEMCEWGDEENEQLNRMKVSDVEGDKNVSGVFQAWDDDDDTYTNDFYCAMTGDFIIRIAEGVTVERGDLLMSAGDGTAKPQDDDIIRSKTIAKVTSTNVSCTYDDGSYCVPCVLMAC
jgi:hypothetical protein